MESAFRILIDAKAFQNILHSIFRSNKTMMYTERVSQNLRKHFCFKSLKSHFNQTRSWFSLANSKLYWANNNNNIQLKYAIDSEIVHDFLQIRRMWKLVFPIYFRMDFGLFFFLEKYFLFLFIPCHWFCLIVHHKIAVRSSNENKCLSIK